MKKLIVNADDFGLTEETVGETIRCFEAGAISSATIMAGMPATDLAVAYARSHPEFSFGVHLYLVDEKPICNPAEIPSLVDPKTGRLWLTRQFIVRNFLGLIKVEDLVREMSAQYDAIASTGLEISHVDGHGHNHRLPQSIEALKQFALGRGLDSMAVRRCQDLPQDHLGRLARLINPRMQKRLEKSGFRMTDHFIMMSGKTDDPGWFSRIVEQLPEGTTEIGIHPGREEKWREIDHIGCLIEGPSLYEHLNLRLIRYDEI